MSAAVKLSEELPERVAYSVRDLTRVLPLGWSACYELARQIGVRHNGGKILVTRKALERWLRSQPPARGTGRRPGKRASQGGSP